MRKGAPVSVRFGLLSLLSAEPMHGYQLRQEFEAATGSTWPLNVGQVYTTLARLGRDGLVEPADDGEEQQRTYRITPAGRQALDRWYAEPVAPAAPPRNELAIKLALAVHHPELDLAAIIHAQRTATMRTLQEYTRAREAAADDLSWQLVADALLFAAEAELRWLDHAEAHLGRRRPARPTGPAAPAAPEATPARIR
jgi:DNA-binding PadR family transcriptional regulator